MFMRGRRKSSHFGHLRKFISDAINLSVFTFEIYVQCPLILTDQFRQSFVVIPLYLLQYAAMCVVETQQMVILIKS